MLRAAKVRGQIGGIRDFEQMEPLPGGVFRSHAEPERNTLLDAQHWPSSARVLCVPEPALPFAVKLNLLHLLRLEGAMGLLHTHRGLF